MCVVDHKGKFRYFTCRHAGSAHDARIFGESSLRAHLIASFNENEPLALLGDEGYAAEDVMLTPVRAPTIASAEFATRQKMKAFNRVHKKSRISIEHAFGILKKRFPVLLYVMRSKTLENIQALIASTIVIHNILIDLKDPSLSSFQVENEYQDHLIRSNINHELSNQIGEKFRLRNIIIDQFF